MCFPAFEVTGFGKDGAAAAAALVDALINPLHIPSSALKPSRIFLHSFRRSAKQKKTTHVVGSALL